MKLSVVLQYLSDVGSMPESWGSAALVRDPREAFESERAYTMVPVVDIRGSEDRRAVEIVVADMDSRQRVRELKARDAASRLKRLAGSHAPARLLVAHPSGKTVRVSGVSADPDLRALVFLQWFKGIEQEL